MPRNVTGTYSLPLPPVIPNDTITSLWANTTLDDIQQALTDSLDRQGRGGMSAPFRVPDGSEAAPSISFNSQTGTGLWVATGKMAISYLGVEVASFGAASADFKQRLLLPDGTAALPAVSFTSNSDTGIYLGLSNIVFVWDGAGRAAIKNVPGFHVGDLAVDGGSGNVGIYNRARLVTTGVTQYGQFDNTMFSTSATNTANGLYVASRFADGAYVTSVYQGVRINTPTLGAGQTVTSGRGLVIEDMGGVTSSYGIFLEGPVAAGTSRWAIWSQGAARSYHEGALGIGVDPPDVNPKLFVRRSTPAASPAWQSIDNVVVQGTNSALVHVHAGATGGTIGFGFTVAAVRNRGALFYTTSSDTMTMHAGSTPAMTWTSSLNRSLVEFRTASNARFEVGATVVGGLQIEDGTSTGLTPNATADSLWIDGTGNIGLSITTLNASTTSIMFGNPTSNNQGGFSYNNTSDILNIRAGAGTRMSISGTAADLTVPLDATTSYSINGTKVVGTRRTGWTAATGTATRTTFATASVTLPVLAEHVKALIDDLIAHGLIGT